MHVSEDGSLENVLPTLSFARERLAPGRRSLREQLCAPSPRFAALLIRCGIQVVGNR
jgi:hypothetical protein